MCYFSDLSESQLTNMKYPDCKLWSQALIYVYVLNVLIVQQVLLPNSTESVCL